MCKHRELCLLRAIGKQQVQRDMANILREEEDEKANQPTFQRKNTRDSWREKMSNEVNGRNISYGGLEARQVSERVTAPDGPKTQSTWYSPPCPFLSPLQAPSKSPHQNERAPKTCQLPVPAGISETQRTLPDQFLIFLPLAFSLHFLVGFSCGFSRGISMMCLSILLYRFHILLEFKSNKNIVLYFWMGISYIAKRN